MCDLGGALLFAGMAIIWWGVYADVGLCSSLVQYSYVSRLRGRLRVFTLSYRYMEWRSPLWAISHFICFSVSIGFSLLVTFYCSVR